MKVKLHRAQFVIINNMITINGRKMGKSYNNVIKLTELFSGTHPLLAKAYHPMTIRFFILQTHYSSTLDFSNEALLAAEKGLKRLWDAVEGFQKLNTQEWGHSAGEDVVLDKKVNQLLDELPLFMNDDFSSAKVLANLFELVPVLNSIKDGITAKSALAVKTLTRMQNELKLWMEDILGLQPLHAADQEKLQGVMELLIDMRKEAKGRRDFMTSDKIRDRLLALGIQLKDEKGGGMSWKID
jgi:cysteinyl-tRNA synthetase